jgi:predicted AlkP superfamily phosphohydrolase/phosphomutase
VILVLGIDAATWTVIKPNLDRLPAWQQICRAGHARDLVITETPVSPAIWCGMFCGKKLAEHGHQAYVKNGNLVTRADIPADFVWDILQRAGKKVFALNVPFIVPPYSFQVNFKPVGFGLPTNPKEWQEELDRVTAQTRQLMSQNPEVLIAVFTTLDRVQHFHWGEPMVLEWYQKVDRCLDELVLKSGFLEDPRNRLIIISDHGFCSFGEAKVRTLPQKTAEGEIKGDHHEVGILITVNLDYPIEKPQDVFGAIKATCL